MSSHEPSNDESSQSRRKLHYPFLTIKDILQLPDPTWLVDGMLLQNTTSLLFGAPKSGKSFLTLDLGMSVASGSDFLGRKVIKPGPVIYVAAEAKDTIKHRLLAWQKHHAITTDELPFRLVPQAVPLMAVGEVAKFTADIWTLVEALAEEVEGQVTTLSAPPVLVVIDTLAKSTIGAEGNSNKEMDFALASVECIREQFNCHCLVVHHTGKGDETPRGASCLVGTPDTLILVKRPDHDGSRITVTCTDQRDAKLFDNIALDLKQIRLSDEDPEATSCILEVAEDTVRTDTTGESQKHTDKSKAQKRAATADLQALQKRQVRQALVAFGAEGATYAQWRAAVPDTITNGTFNRHRESLVAAGDIVKGKRKDGKRSVDVYILSELMADKATHPEDGGEAA